MKYDIFISHSSVDKETIARPLAEALQQRGLTVWLDEEQLQLGDSIRRGIDEALRHSRFGVILLSPAYLDSEWTRKELDALFTKEKHHHKTILPIFHNITQEEIEAFSPMLADKISLTTDSDIEAVAKSIHSSTQQSETQAIKSPLSTKKFKWPDTNWQWMTSPRERISASIPCIFISLSVISTVML